MSYVCEKGSGGCGNVKYDVQHRKDLHCSSSLNDGHPFLCSRCYKKKQKMRQCATPGCTSEYNTDFYDTCPTCERNKTKKAINQRPDYNSTEQFMLHSKSVRCDNPTCEQCRVFGVVITPTVLPEKQVMHKLKGTNMKTLVWFLRRKSIP